MNNIMGIGVPREMTSQLYVYYCLHEARFEEIGDYYVNNLWVTLNRYNLHKGSTLIPEELNSVKYIDVLLSVGIMETIETLSSHYDILRYIDVTEFGKTLMQNLKRYYFTDNYSKFVEHCDLLWNKLFTLNKIRYREPFVSLRSIYNIEEPNTLNKQVYAHMNMLNYYMDTTEQDSNITDNITADNKSNSKSNNNDNVEESIPENNNTLISENIYLFPDIPVYELMNQCEKSDNCNMCRYFTLCRCIYERFKNNLIGEMNDKIPQLDIKIPDFVIDNMRQELENL